ncbi:hypothetical protein AMTRI_Chr01g104460 [Amborella trichopoda]
MNFHKCFPKEWGFSVRRKRTIGKEGDGNRTTKRYYVCHRADHLTYKDHSEIKREKERSSRRCNRGAQLGLEMQRYIRVFRLFTCDNFVYVILKLYIRIIVVAILLRSYYKIECGCDYCRSDFVEKLL